MAKTKGCLGVVLVGASPTAVGEVRSISMNEVAAVNEGAAMGSCDSQPRPGIVTSTGQITAWFDQSDAGQALILVGATLDIVYRPGGTGSGLPQRSITDALITEVATSGNVANDVEVTFSFQGPAVSLANQA